MKIVRVELLGFQTAKTTLGTEANGGLGSGSQYLLKTDTVGALCGWQ